MDDATTTNTTLFTTDEDCSNWSELHEDMLHLIFKKLTSATDCIRFGSVCVSWRPMQFVYLHPDLLHPQLPLLMIPTQSPQLLTNTKEEEEEEETRSFYVLSDRSVYKDLKISLPYNRNCRGSSHGWIITSTQEDTGYSVEMLNPFISINNEYQKIQLPPLTVSEKNMQDYSNCFYPQEYLHKAIVSLNPLLHPRDYVVMIIYGRETAGRLGFWRPGDQVWTLVHLGRGFIVHDAIYYMGQFYAVDLLAKIAVIDLNGCGGGGNAPPPSVSRLDMPPWPATPGLPRLDNEQMVRHSIRKYLVESAGDLLLVDKGAVFVEDAEFRVYKLITTTEKKATCYKWEVVLNTLPGGRMLFVGDNASISLAASDFPGGKSSCIYFTDDGPRYTRRHKRYLRSGIFNMEQHKTIENLRPMGDYIPPIWVESTLRRCFRFRNETN